MAGDIERPPSGGWSVARFGLAARHLGRFNGVWLKRGGVLAQPWLASFARVHDYWPTRPETQPALELLFDEQRWAQMVARSSLPIEPYPHGLRRVLADRAAYFEALERLPQTLCHNDAMPLNLFAQADEYGREETVAIDWQLCGPGPVGSELALLVPASVMFLRARPDELAALDETCLDEYTAGVNDIGADVDTDDVRAAYAACYVFRMGPLVAAWTDAVLSDPEWTSGFWRRPADELARQWAPLIGFLERQANRATDWLDRHAPKETLAPRG